MYMHLFFFFFSSRRRHTRCSRDWSSDVCSSDLELPFTGQQNPTAFRAAPRDGQEALVQLRSVSPSYFRSAGIAMHRGRAFSIDDDGKHPNVIVINEALASMMFG